MMNTKSDMIRRLKLIDDDTLLQKLVDSAALELVDLMTIRDLMALADPADRELLHLLIAAFVELNRGSLCLKLTAPNLQAKLQPVLGDELVDAAPCIQRVLDGAWSEIVAQDPSEFRPLVLRRDDDVPYLYFQQNLKNANALHQALNTLLAADDMPVADAETMRSVLQDVLARQEHQLNAKQQLAVALALTKRFCVVSGGPGTGKTSIIVTVLHGLLGCGVAADEIVLAAPTGRAAQRMSESLQHALDDDTEEQLSIKGQTIHRLLQYRPRTNDFRFCAKHPLPVKAVIIDEVSMVDVALMARLLEAVPDDARVLFLGDKDQLPSVDAGAVLADLIPQNCPITYSAGTVTHLAEILPGVELPEPGDELNELSDRVVILNASYRSEQRILELAGAVNRNEANAIEQVPRLDVTVKGLQFPSERSGAYFAEILANKAEPIQVVLDSWAFEHYLATVRGRSWRRLIDDCRKLDFAALPEVTPENHALLDELFARLTYAQILTFVRQGYLGANGVNRYLDIQLRRTFDPNTRGRFFAGAPIIIQRNDRAKDLFNGDVGIVLKDTAGNYRAVFRRMGEYQSYSIDALPPHDLAFAITVHKSQGSEYNRVLLVLPGQEENRLLSKEIVYTGLTRAKEMAVIVGPEPVLRTAIQRRIERETGFSIWGKLEKYAPTADIESIDAVEETIEIEDVQDDPVVEPEPEQTDDKSENDEPPDDFSDLPLFGGQ